VRSGAVDLRTAAMSSAYDEALDAAFERTWSAYQRLDRDGRDALVRETREQLDAYFGGQPRP
jgi:hypothetical protein